MSLGDLQAIAQIPTVELMSPEIIRQTKTIFNGKILDARCIGVQNSFLI
jgi:hypothetical protein